MKRRDPHVTGPIPDELDHPLTHLSSGLIGESNRQNLADPDAALGDQVGDPARQDCGLSRTSAGDDQQRGSLVHDREALLGVKTVEQVVCLRVGHVGMNSHSGTNLPPAADKPPRGELQLTRRRAGLS